MAISTVKQQAMQWVDDNLRDLSDWHQQISDFRWPEYVTADNGERRWSIPALPWEGNGA